MFTNYRLMLAMGLLALLGGLFTSPSTVLAQSAEAKVKTAYLYSLMSGSEWPAAAFENADAPYVVGVLGADQLDGLLDQVASKKKIKKRKLELKRWTSADQIGPCHLLYVCGTVDPTVQQAVLAKIKGTNTLLVAETTGFSQTGAMINFYPDADGTIGFEVNEAAAKGQSVTIDPKMIKLGKKVG